MDRGKKCVKIMNVEAKSDCNPPKLSLENYYNPGKLERNVRRVLEIDKENMELLKRLYIISQSPGKVRVNSGINEENTNPNDVDQNKSENERIRSENLEIYKSLQQVVSKVSAFLPEKQNKKRKKYMGLRPRCFFEIYIPKTNQNLGGFEIELYADIVPNICEKFKSLCSGINDSSYKGAVFHKIIYGYLCQCQCDLKANADDDKSMIDEEKLEEDNFLLKHSGPGILSLIKSDKNSFVFNLTFKKLEILDGKHVVFGKVVRAISNIYKIEAVGTKRGKPREKIIISNCGIR